MSGARRSVCSLCDATRENVGQKWYRVTEYGAGNPGTGGYVGVLLQACATCWSDINEIAGDALYGQPLADWAACLARAATTERDAPPA